MRPRLDKNSGDSWLREKSREALKTFRAWSPSPSASNLEPRDPGCQCPPRLCASSGRHQSPGTGGAETAAKSIRTGPRATLEPTSQSRRRFPKITGTWRAGRGGMGVSGMPLRAWSRCIGISPTFWHSCSGGRAGCSLAGEVPGCCARPCG